MAKHRTHSVEFKQQVSQEYLSGETLHPLAKRHDISRNLIRIWVEKFQAGALDEDLAAADLLQDYEARISDACILLSSRRVIGPRCGLRTYCRRGAATSAVAISVSFRRFHGIGR